jgi:hypothetical protein
MKYEYCNDCPDCLKIDKLVKDDDGFDGEIWIKNV